MPADVSAEEIQTVVYETGKRPAFREIKDWFRGCYEVLLGQEQGPRMGSFIKLYGVDETIALLNKAIKGEDLV